MSAARPHDPYLALRFGNYRLLLVGFAITYLGNFMLALAIGWELYDRTSSAMALGLVGLVQLIPVIALALIVGHVTDRYERKTIVILSQLAMVVAALGLGLLAGSQGSLEAIYACLLLRGIGSAFSMPAQMTLPAVALPPEAYENGASWRTSIGEVAAIVGPAVGGGLIAVLHGTAVIFFASALASLAYVALLIGMRDLRSVPTSADPNAEKPSLRSLLEGAHFLRRTPSILSAITLDLFAVLFGGATALLPIFARDILQVGPTGLGWLQAAPALGALVATLYLAHRPALQQAGPTLLLVVAGFGLATIVFGLSQSFALSLLMLFALGGLDGVSMVIRDTLMLARIPHEMRGRVAAIEGVFISSSNQLGAFESGLTAQLFGPILSVVGGGIGTIVVVIVVALSSPALRELRTLHEAVANPDAEPAYHPTPSYE